MRRVPALLLAALVVAPGVASADELIDIVYELTASVSACVAASVSFHFHFGLDTTQWPPVTVGLPSLNPLNPECLGVVPTA